MNLINLYISATVLGITSLITQITLLRELLTVYQSNELNIGLTLSLWLIFVGTGTLISSSFSKLFTAKTLNTIHFTLSILIPLTLIALRYSRIILNLPFGTNLSFPLLLLNFMFTAPLCIIYGIQFNVISTLLQSTQNANPNKAYIYETLGTFTGGIIFSFIFAGRMNSLTLCLLISILNNIVTYFIITRNDVKTSQSKPIKEGFSNTVIATILLLTLFNSQTLDLSIRQKMWENNYQILTSKDTKYGNILLLKRDNQYSIYENGALTFTTQNTEHAEYLTHLALLSNPKIQNVLIITGGPLVIQEVLRYPNVRSILYTDLDPGLVDIYKQIPAGAAVFQNKKVTIINTDARRYVNSTIKDKFDAVILSAPAPTTLFFSRYFTQEFFLSLNNILSANGILSLSFPSSDVYLTNELIKINASIYSALRNSFPSTYIFPGNTAYAVSYCNSKTPQPGIKQYLINLKLLKPKPSTLNRHNLPFKFDKYKLQYWHSTLTRRDEHSINTDSHPVTYTAMIALWLKSTTPEFNTYTVTAAHNQLTRILKIIIPVISVILILVLVTRNPNGLQLGTVFLYGGLSMCAEILLLLNFQVIYGYLYEQISLLISAFMIGLCIGSILAEKMLNTKTFTGEKLLRYLTNSTIFLYLTAFILGIIFVNYSIAGTLFFISMLLISLPVGAIYTTSLHFTKNAGILYFFDLLGAGIASLSVTLYFIPEFGISLTFILTIIVLAVLAAIINMIKLD